MAKFFIALGVSALTMLVLDGLWLSLIARTFYEQHIGHLMAEQVNWFAVALFYPLFVVSIVVFVVLPSVEKASLARAALLGALFGLVTYGTYDLTNQASLKNWPTIVTLVDMIWGTVLSATVSAATVFFTRLAGRNPTARAKK